MHVLILCLLAVSLTVSAIPTNSQRITGGTQANIVQYNSIVSLQYSQYGTVFTHACAGTIINERSVLTAAHCISGSLPYQWRIQIGSGSIATNNMALLYRAMEFIIHPEFNSRTLLNDIALIKTSTQMNLISIFAGPAVLANESYTVETNHILVAAGWGRNNLNENMQTQLQAVQLRPANHELCTHYYSFQSFRVTDSMLCAQGSWVNGGQCAGDDGGPLYHNNVLVGVFSWSHGCGLTHYPGVNTRVSSYYNWIQANA